MPGTSIGTKFPSSVPKTVIHAEIIIRKQDGKYSLSPLQPRIAEDTAILEEVRRALEAAINKWNGK
jgi:hypothetical protein